MQPSIAAALTIATVAGILGLSGCDDERFCTAPVVRFDPNAPCPAVHRYPSAIPPTSPEGFLTLDEAYTWVATQVPGFGGAYWTDAGTLVIYLLDPTQAGAEAARAAIAEVFHEPTIAGTPVDPALGRFDWLQLMDARGQLESNLPIDGWAWSDTDETANRVVIGWYDPMIPKCWTETLRGLGMPADIAGNEFSGPVCVN